MPPVSTHKVKGVKLVCVEVGVCVTVALTVFVGVAVLVGVTVGVAVIVGVGVGGNGKPFIGKNSELVQIPLDLTSIIEVPSGTLLVV
jgi:hypothetical protein